MNVTLNKEQVQALKKKGNNYVHKSPNREQRRAADRLDLHLKKNNRMMYLKRKKKRILSRMVLPQIIEGIESTKRIYHNRFITKNH